MGEEGKVNLGKKEAQVHHTCNKSFTGWICWLLLGVKNTPARLCALQCCSTFSACLQMLRNLSMLGISYSKSLLSEVLAPTTNGEAKCFQMIRASLWDTARMGTPVLVLGGVQLFGDPPSFLETL